MLLGLVSFLILALLTTVISVLSRCESNYLFACSICLWSSLLSWCIFSILVFAALANVFLWLTLLILVVIVIIVVSIVVIVSVWLATLSVIAIITIVSVVLFLWLWFRLLRFWLWFVSSTLNNLYANVWNVVDLFSFRLWFFLLFSRLFFSLRSLCLWCFFLLRFFSLNFFCLWCRSCFSLRFFLLL